jgi:hypothetical protein
MRRFNASPPQFRLRLLRFCSLLIVVTILNPSSWGMPTPPAEASISDLWHSIFRNPPPPPPRRGISRGDDFCPVAPIAQAETTFDQAQLPSEQSSSMAELPKVWSDRPTLAWFGTSTAVREMAIFPKDSETHIWVWSNPELQQSNNRTASEPRSPHYVRVETSLAPGQIYEWHVIRPLEPEQEIIRFQTLTDEEINSIAEDLPAASEAGIASALARANYFAGQHLWSDFWQEIFSVQSPSAELNQLITETFEAQCPRTDDSAQP